MIDMIICKTSHEIVTMIISFLHPQIHFAFAVGGLDEMLGQKLLLSIEFVGWTLYSHPTKYVSRGSSRKLIIYKTTRIGEVVGIPHRLEYPTRSHSIFLQVRSHHAEPIVLYCRRQSNRKRPFDPMGMRKGWRLERRLKRICICQDFWGTAFSQRESRRYS